MRIIRPYGDSRSEHGSDSAKRVLYDKSSSPARHDIASFARSHNELVIAQWISIIDKVVTKPHGKDGVTLDQRTLRDKIGKAAWQRLVDEDRLRIDNEEHKAKLHALWNFKVHPYGKVEYTPKWRGGKPSLPPKTEGRWYKVFTGDISVQDADAVQVAERISKHLYEAEYRIKPSLQNRRRGMIEARAESITGNVLSGQTPKRKQNRSEWNEQDIKTYSSYGDVARIIREKAIECEQKKDRVRLNIAASCLFDHWAKVFRNSETGEVLNIEGAKQERFKGQYSLHMEIKETYTRILKHHRKDARDHKNGGRKISDILPKNMEELRFLSDAHNKNTELALLVRIGKVMHYTASGDNADSPATIDINWPSDFCKSRFWTSDGQAEIKRAESFVRVWRHVLAYAGLTLRDWASMKVPFKGDILGDSNTPDQAVGRKNYDRDKFERKLRLLFGNRSQIFSSGTDEDLKNLLRAAINATTNLRHRVFHFKGRGMFLDGLRDVPANFQGQSLSQTRALWEADAVERTARLKATLRAAHVEHFFNDSQNRTIVNLLAPQASDFLPLPRFSRVLLRVKNAWGKDDNIKLPKRANRRALEDPARLCQYTVLKIIYERPFRSWLEGRGESTLGKWIDKAITRTTVEAQKINTGNNEESRKFITARAEVLPKPKTGKDIRGFFFDLSAATASEMRVQRGYESNGEKAREQAEYIDEFLCDILILALTDYIKEKGLDWLLDLHAPQQRPQERTCDIDTLIMPEVDITAEDWQVALYFILHLIPVDDVGKLLHQMNKWEITAGRNTIPAAEETNRLHRLQTVMKLYLDMHDAKFEGGTPLAVDAEFRDLFATNSGFNRVFLSQGDSEEDTRVPQRGLREIMRFGHLPLLKKMSSPKITDALIDGVIQSEEAIDGGLSQIARWQQKREDLHEKWVENKRLEPDDLRGYCEALATITIHRHAAAQTYLIDHVRIHRLTMAVLGRLVDYAGLFERDLYFVILALVHHHKVTPAVLFNADGLTHLQNGRILSALIDTNSGGVCSDIEKELRSHFGEVWKNDKSCRTNRDIRNDLAHLNMLQAYEPAPDLTHWVNQTRQLMAYDRKLKNAVSLSIRELLQREGITISWRMSLSNDRHMLTDASVKSDAAIHLGGKKCIGGYCHVSEALHSPEFVAMVAKLFDGIITEIKDVTTLDMNRVDWSNINKPKGKQKTRNQDNAVRPPRENSGRKLRKYK